MIFFLDSKLLEVDFRCIKYWKILSQLRDILFLCCVHCMVLILNRGVVCLFLKLIMYLLTLPLFFFCCKLDTLNMHYFLHDFITLLGWLKILVYACLIILSYSRPFRDFGKLELIRPSINFLDIWMIIETCKRGSLIFCVRKFPL